jgi:uncharacterized membrane protein YdjX (TVP38/TMEM64 family)
VIGINVWIKLFSFALILVLLVLALNTDALSPLLSGDLDALHHASNGSISLFLFFTMILMIVQNLFTVIPLILLISVNVSLFGFSYGYIWSWFTSIIAGVISFLAARYWFQHFFKRWVSSKWQGKIESNGFMVVFVGRVFPFVPTSVVNIAAGLSSIGMKPFVYGTILGNMIYFFVLALLPLGVMSVHIEPYIYIVIILLAVAGAFAWRSRKRKKARSKPDSES